MYRFIGKDVEPLPGLPLEADDDEFMLAVADYESRFEGAEGSVLRSGLYEHVSERARRREATEAEAPPQD